MIGGNFCLDALQAAIVSVKLRYLDGWTERRNRNAERYKRLFATSGLAISNTRDWARVRNSNAKGLSSGPQVVLPTVVGQRHVFNQYVIRVPCRDTLMTELVIKFRTVMRMCRGRVTVRAGNTTVSRANSMKAEEQTDNQDLVTCH